MFAVGRCYKHVWLHMLAIFRQPQLHMWAATQTACKAAASVLSTDDTWKREIHCRGKHTLITFTPAHIHTYNWHLSYCKSWICAYRRMVSFITAVTVHLNFLLSFYNACLLKLHLTVSNCGLTAVLTNKRLPKLEDGKVTVWQVFFFRCFLTETAAARLKPKEIYK